MSVRTGVMVMEMEMVMVMVGSGSARGGIDQQRRASPAERGDQRRQTERGGRPGG